MGDSALPGAAAAAVAQAEAAARIAAAPERPRAGAPSVAGGASPAEPKAATEVTSADHVRWTGQFEGEFRVVRGDVIFVSSKVDELAASIPSLKDAVAACSCSNSSTATPIGGVLRVVGETRGSVFPEVAAHRRVCCMEYINVAEALEYSWSDSAESRRISFRYQSFLGEGVHATARVVAQLRSLSDFDVAQYGPRMHGSEDHAYYLYIPDSLEPLRSALVAVLSVGLSPENNGDIPCLDRVSALSAEFTSAAAELRANTLCSMDQLSSSTARQVMGDMVNHDLRLWANNLMRAAQETQPLVVPPPPDRVFSMPPLSAFQRTGAFCGGGGDVLRLIGEVSNGRRGGGDGSTKR